MAAYAEPPLGVCREDARYVTPRVGLNNPPMWRGNACSASKSERGMIDMAQRQNATRSAVPALAYSRRDLPARWGLALIEAVIGYEWLISALNKILDSHFSAGLGGQLKKDLGDNPNRWYSDFLKGTILPHAQFYATLIEIGELLVGLGLLLGAALWLSRRLARSPWARLLNWVVILALAGGALMTANYYLKDGQTFPGLDPGNPYSEGVTIDGLLTLVALGLLVAHLLALRAPRTVRATDE